MSRSPVLFAFALGVLSTPLLADDATPTLPADGKQTEIRVTEETTRITAPLTDDGYVDYLEATNERFSKGATAENNFEAVVRRVLGPEEIVESVRAEYHRRLGIPVPPVEGDYYRSLHDVAKYVDMTPPERKAFDADYDATLEHPWRSADHPRTVEWLKSMNGHLDAVVEGSRRTHNYVPYVVPPPAEGTTDPSPKMMGVLLPSVQSQRELTRGLKLRAMNRLGEGNVVGAWSDLQAIHRQARLVDDGATIIEALVGIALDSTAFHGDALVLQSEKLTPAQTQQYLADLERLTPIASMAEKIDIGERFMGLDAVQSLAVHGAQSIDQLAGGDGGEATVWGKMLGAMIKGSGLAVDYNVTMELMNDWYDRLVDATSEPNRSDRLEKFATLNADIKELTLEAQDSVATARKLLLSGQPNKVMGRAIGNILVSLLLPAVQQAHAAEERADAYLTVTRLGFALRVYRTETGKAPEALADLVPQYVKSIPVDPQTGEALVYRVADGDVLVYGRGQNGRDDKGVGYNDRPEGDRESDDIAVRFRVK